MAKPSRREEPAEVRDFRKALKARSGSTRPLAELFGAGTITLARAPARLDVMGGIADYSGSHVCEYPLAQGTVVGVQERDDRRIRVASVNVAAHGLEPEFEIALDALDARGRPLTYARAHRLLTRDPKRAWAAYLVGSLLTLLREGKLAPLKRGLNLGALSRVPMNVGVASSGALEVATLRALDLHLDLGLDPVELARLGQVGENRVVGAPCGVMDQLVASVGREGEFLHILCQPHTVVGTVEPPEFAAFAGINSGVKHSVGGARYTDTRVATFMGRKIIFDRLRKAGRAPFGGYLCNITPDAYAEVYRAWLPARMTGAEFLEVYRTTDDPVAAVVPDKTYAVESRTSHPVYESWRVLQFMMWLEHARLSGERACLVRAGEMMYGSHWSYARKCGMSCKEVDFLVGRARELGPEAGVYGAKITGGGSGGTVAVMGEADRLPAAVDRIVDGYEQAFGIRADVFTGSSSGAFAYGGARIAG